MSGPLLPSLCGYIISINTENYLYMRKIYLGALCLAMSPLAIFAQSALETDSIDMLAYSMANGRSGLLLAVQDAQGQWQPIPLGSVVTSDFGPWGSHKTMFNPKLTMPENGQWKATWIADTAGNVYAETYSPDLIKWGAQRYKNACQHRKGYQSYQVNGEAVVGNVVRVPSSVVSNLRVEAEKRAEKNALYGEQMKDDATRFASLQPLTYYITPDRGGQKAISDKLMGIFFEDINYAADGGLYGELIQNRDFEYAPTDRGNDKNWNSLSAWSASDDFASAHIATLEPIHANNPHYLQINGKKGLVLSNEGYDGIPVKSGETYDGSLMARGKGRLSVKLVDPNGKVLATAPVKFDSKGWTKCVFTLTPSETCADAKLNITLEKNSQFDLDMVSLFPQKTFKGRTNGLRQDLAQTLADLQPRFVRFPGGCVAHGDGIDNIYDWKGSIGPLEARKPLRNLWGYHQTRGLGYHEYFLFCEDIGAEPLPVLAAGVPCQNSGTAAHHSHDAVTTLGQQGGIPMEEMPEYVQDVLDLIEYANGPVTSVWGSKRAAAGHPEPFNLKYIGIGNEDMITEVFVPRFKMIYEAVQAKHPEVAVVGTVGPFYEGTDYDLGWDLARELSIPYVDEHYYVSPGWLIYNQDYYDDYQRGPGKTQVYLGEWASHLPGRPSNLETALSEALYLTSVERNADVVALSSYAPLLSKDNHTQWRPDLIYFNNTEIRPTVDYYVQQLYGQNSGDQYIPAATQLTSEDEKAIARVGSSIVRDSATGDLIIKLANLLPVEVTPQLNLSTLGIVGGSEAKAKVISGRPTDDKLTPVSTQASIGLDGAVRYVMPPYSFTVIRVPSK